MRRAVDTAFAKTRVRPGCAASRKYSSSSLSSSPQCSVASSTCGTLSQSIRYGCYKTQVWQDCPDRR